MIRKMLNFYHNPGIKEIGSMWWRIKHDFLFVPEKASLKHRKVSYHPQYKPRRYAYTWGVLALHTVEFSGGIFPYFSRFIFRSHPGITNYFRLDVSFKSCSLAAAWVTI